MKAKRITAMFMASVATLSMTMPAFATDAIEETPEQTRETVNIAGYDCWEEDGNYFAEVDGEVSLIIDLTDMSRLPKCVNVTKVGVVASPAAVYSADRYDIDLSDGSEYEGEIDITNGDCATPIFYASYTSPYSRFKFKTDFILPRKYSFTAWVDYADEYGYGMHNWYREDVEITFSLLKNSYNSFILVEGNKFGAICKLVFHKEGSTGDPKFNYSMKAF